MEKPIIKDMHTGMVLNKIINTDKSMHYVYNINYFFSESNIFSGIEIKAINEIDNLKGYELVKKVVV